MGGFTVVGGSSSGGDAVVSVLSLSPLSSSDVTEEKCPT